MEKTIFFVLVFLSFVMKGELILDKTLFATKDKGQKILTTEDEYTDRWSQFDIDSRLRKHNGTKEELLKYFSKQVRNWTEQEKFKISKILKSIDDVISENGFKIKLPSEIYFIKTTSKEEGRAQGYTRANSIVLKRAELSMNSADLKKLIIHELFHVLSRTNKDFRKKMYKIIGFTIVNEISYTGKLKNFRIGNPDAPLTDSYITLKKDSENIDCAMILYAKKEYDGGTFFRYMRIGFLVLQGGDNKQIKYVNGEPVIYSLKQVSNFYQQTGKNTGYIINPEEILAENFTYAITNKSELTSQWVVDQVRKVLKE